MVQRWVETRATRPTESEHVLVKQGNPEKVYNDIALKNADILSAEVNLTKGKIPDRERFRRLASMSATHNGVCCATYRF